MNLDPEASASIRRRSDHARQWAGTDAEPPHGPVFLPLSVREHFDSDVPALLGEIERLSQLLAEQRTQGRGRRTCAVCRGQFTVTKAGVMRDHRVPADVWVSGWRAQCAGVGQPPLEGGDV